MNIFIEEIGTGPNSTASQLFVDGKPFCFVIEDGHRDQKIAGETRIPAGRYQVIKWQGDSSFLKKYGSKYKHVFVPLLKDVPGFSGILIHIGNTPKDTRGYLLVNKSISINKGEYTGSLSTLAYLALYTQMSAAFEAGNEIWVEISRREIVDENTPKG